MNFCPCCGTDLERYAPIERDGFRSDLTGSFAFRGRPIPLTQSQHLLVHTVMAARPGAIVRRDTILDRMGSDGDNNLVSVQLCRIRERIRRAGAPCPIESVQGRGLRWGIVHAA